MKRYVVKETKMLNEHKHIVFDHYTKADWKEVAKNLLYTLEHGDGEMAEWMCEKYTEYLLPDEEDDDDVE
jgi:hypothetical protein